MEGRIRKDNLEGFMGKHFWRKRLGVNEENREEAIMLSNVLAVRFEIGLPRYNLAEAPGSK
jgi:hypothetical protein